MNGFDVIHSHGDDCFLLGKRRPWHVRTLHGASFSEMRANRGFKIRANLFLLGLGEHLSLRVADVCVANSRATIKHFPGVKLHIPCGVDLSTFTPGVRKSEQPTILFVGGITGKKRGWLMQKVFLEEIRKSIPNARLWVVSGEEIQGEGIDFFGRVSLDKLIELYQSAWLFCLPSEYEGFGVPYVEAMACGTPVVASFNDGSIETTSNGKFGRLCHDELLGATLIELLSDSSTRSLMSEAGVERAKEFGWHQVCLAYENVYKQGGKAPC